MKKMTIIYGTSTNNTKNAAMEIAEQFKDFTPVLKDVSKTTVEDFTLSDVLIIGTSTWGFGELQDDWDEQLKNLKNIELQGKIVALFGLGDSDSYPDTFVDGMGILYDFFIEKGCTIVGNVSTADYSFEGSVAVRNNQFVGLPLNEDGEGGKTSGRIKNWVNELKPILS